jgi:hypothetical protein
VEALRRDIKPVVENAAVVEQNAAALLDAYRALPAQMEERFAPSWAELEPEITCQLADGAGYGGCWHSRITALPGEAANAGSVFSGRFRRSRIAPPASPRRFARLLPRPSRRAASGEPSRISSASGSGTVRALGAAGLFDPQSAIPNRKRKHDVSKCIYRWMEKSQNGSRKGCGFPNQEPDDYQECGRGSRSRGIRNRPAVAPAITVFDQREEQVVGKVREREGCGERKFARRAIRRGLAGDPIVEAGARKPSGGTVRAASSSASAS